MSGNDPVHAILITISAATLISLGGCCPWHCDTTASLQQVVQTSNQQTLMCTDHL